MFRNVAIYYFSLRLHVYRYIITATKISLYSLMTESELTK